MKIDNRIVQDKRAAKVGVRASTVRREKRSISCTASSVQATRVLAASVAAPAIASDETRNGSPSARESPPRKRPKQSGRSAWRVTQSSGAANRASQLRVLATMQSSGATNCESELSASVLATMQSSGAANCASELSVLAATADVILTSTSIAATTATHACASTTATATAVQAVVAPAPSAPAFLSALTDYAHGHTTYPQVPGPLPCFISV